MSTPTGNEDQSSFDDVRARAEDLLNSLEQLLNEARSSFGDEVVGRLQSLVAELRANFDQWRSSRQQ